MTEPELGAARRLPGQERSRVRVELILDTAAELIARDGIDAMSMRDLSIAAGVSMPSIYRYFPGKQAIVRTLMARYAAQVRAMVIKDRTIHSPDQARQAMTESMQAYWSLYSGDPAYSAVWSAAVADPELARHDAAESRQTGALIAESLRGVVAEDDLENLELVAFVCAHLAGAVARLASQLEPAESELVIAAFTERMLPAAFGLETAPKGPPSDGSADPG